MLARRYIISGALLYLAEAFMMSVSTTIRALNISPVDASLTLAEGFGAYGDAHRYTLKANSSSIRQSVMYRLLFLLPSV